MPLRILADENVALDVIVALRNAGHVALRNAGHDVVWASELRTPLSDDAWLALAEADGRLLLTNDKDFGDLVFRDRQHSTVGVILLRFGGTEAWLQAAILRAVLELDIAWYGRFSVLTAHLLRQVRLPDRRA